MTRAVFLLMLALGPLQLPVFAQERTGSPADVDVEAAAHSMTMVSETVRTLSPESREQAAESLRFLSVNCPYTRAALQLPFAMQAALAQIDPEGLDPVARRDLAHLAEGLQAHVDALEALGVDLSLPQPGDHLHGWDGPMMVDVQELQAAEEPVLLAWPLVHEISAIATQIDEPTMELIHLHSDLVESRTGVERPCPRGPWSIRPGHPWTLGMQLSDWHEALRHLEPLARDRGVQNQISTMVDLLEAYGQAGFETVASRAL